MTYLPSPATCSTCGFTTSDIALLSGHSCDVQDNGGRCEDFPCCGHESGDCNGLLYGSDEAIKAAAYAAAYAEFAEEDDFGFECTANTWVTDEDGETYCDFCCVPRDEHDD